MRVDLKPVAEHWPVERLGDLSTITLGGTPSTLIPMFWGGDLRWMASGDVNLRQVWDVPGRITAKGLSSSNATLVDAPSVAIGLAGQGKTRGTAALVHIRLCTNQSIALIRGNEGVLDTRYLFHNLDGRYEELRARSSGGGRGGLSRSILAEVPVARPPLSEQRRIAEILDTLDEAIRKTEQVIAKLQQMKQGLLHDLLTRGIDKHGELRDPVRHPEQFKETPAGRIPTAWVAGVAADWCSQLTVGVVNSATHAYVSEGVPFIRSQNVRPNRIEVDGLLFVTSQFNRRQKKSILRAGDVVIVRTGYPGTAAVVPPELDGANCFSLVVARPDPYMMRGHFLAHYLNSDGCKAEIARMHFGSAQHNFNVGEMKRLPLVLPPLEEQDAILACASGIETRLESEEGELAKLRSLKVGLMDDLLTGRVRVNVGVEDAA